MKIKILLISISVIVFVSMIGIFSIYKIGDILIEKALEAEILNALSESRIDNLYSERGTKTTTERSGSEVAGTGPSKESRVEAKSEYPNPTNKKSIAENNKKAAKSKDNRTSASDNKAQTRENKISLEKIKEIKDRVSAADKMKAGTLLLKRLSSSDIEQLFKMIEDGVTKEELERAKKLVYERFTAEEIAEIKEIYRKYMYN
ncbi:MAG TPA: hypothetical protein GXX36_07400 [Clostridiaceae bacterium]|nr:hypothetical protein [Clostridiaceae bacterium]